jgi:hypothetical protein
MRAEAMRRQLADALRYPSFVLLAACSVLIFFLLFVLPQFGAILRDFNAKLDPVVVVFLTLSDLLRQHGSVLLGFCSALATGGMLALRTPRLRARAIALGARAGDPLNAHVSSNRMVLPESRRVAGKWRRCGEIAAYSRRHDDGYGGGRHMAGYGRPGSPWQKNL